MGEQWLLRVEQAELRADLWGRSTVHGLTWPISPRTQAANPC